MYKARHAIGKMFNIYLPKAKEDLGYISYQLTV